MSIYCMRDGSCVDKPAMLTQRRRQQIVRVEHLTVMIFDTSPNFCVRTMP